MNKRKIILLGLLATLLLLGIFLNPVSRDHVWSDSYGEPIDTHTLAYGESWLAGWQYRKQMPVTESAGAGELYPFKIDVNYDAEAGPANSIDLEGHCATDFVDVRFTDGDGVSPLDYWMEEKTDSDDATFWVEVADDVSTTGDDVRIYCYYGKTGETSDSDIDATFIWADDFENNNLNKWSNAEAAWSTQSSIKKYGSYAAKGNGQASGRYLDENMADITTDVMIMNYAYSTGTTNYMLSQFHRSDDPSGQHLYAIAMDGNGAGDPILFYNGASYIQWGAFSYSAATWYRQELGFDFTNDKWYYWQDGVAASNNPVDAKGSSGVIHDNIVQIRALAASAGDDLYLDNYIIRKWQVSEPWFSSALTGSEEHTKVDTVSAQVNNPDDTNRIYAEYREYYFGTIVSIESGYADVTYLVMHLKQGVGTYASLKYDQDTDTFSKLSGAVTLDTGNSEAIGSGQDLNCTFYVTVGFGTPHLEEYFFDIDAYDVYSGSDTDDYGDYDVYSDLDFSSFSLDDGSGTADRGDYNSIDSITAGGTVVYLGTSVNPDSADVDVFTYQQNVAGSPWTDTTLVDGVFSMTADSDDTIASWDYTFVVVAEGDDWDDTDLCHATHTDNYIADRIQVQSYSSDDARINIGTQASMHVTIYYDYLNQIVEDGDFEINGVAATYSGSDGIWDFMNTEETVTGTTYNSAIVTATNEHGITKEDQNSQELLQVWDRIHAVSLVYGGDTRVDIGTSINFDYELHYDFDEADVTDGTITINGETFEHQGSGVWRYTTDGGGVVGDITFDSIVASGNTHGITVTTTDGNDVTLIWDKLVVLSGGVLDGRINTDATGTVWYQIKWEWDDEFVTSGLTGYLVGDKQLLWDAGNARWYFSESKSSVQEVEYDVDTLTESTYGISVFSDFVGTKSIIWDRIKVLLIASNNTYCELNDYVLLTVGLEYEYDHAAITAGTFSLRYGSTYLTLTHDASGNWTVTDSSASATSRTYDFVNGSATLYGITAVNIDSKTVTVHWGRIILVVTINDGWTVVGWNVTITISGTYEGTGWIWNGTATFNSTWTATFYPEQSTAGNYSFVVTSITNDDMDLIGFSANTVWCIWDDIAFSSPVYYWVQYTVDQVWLIWYAGATTYWEINGTCDGVKIQSHMNETDDDWTYVLNNATGEMSIGPFNTAWYFVNITINAEFSGFDWILWTRILMVDILHSIHIEDSGMDIQDDWITFWIHSSWGNSTFTIADNMTGSFVEVGYSDSEGWYQIAKPTVIGTHWYWILVNGSHSGSSSSGQTLDPSLTSDSWVWLDFKFTVNPVTFSITELLMMQNNVSVIVAGFWHTPNTTLTWTANEAGIFVDSGTLTLAASGEYNAIYWLKNDPITFNNFTLSITADGSTINLHSYSYILDSASYITYVAGGTVLEGDTFFNETIVYENPPGFYITAEIAAVIAVSGVFIAFFAYLLVRNLLQKKRIDVESGGD